MWIAVLAGLAMLVTDVLATILVQCEAAGKGWLAGGIDAACWLVSITCTSISVNTLTSGSGPTKAALIVCVSIANVLGTKVGAELGKRILKSKLIGGNPAHPASGELSDGQRTEILQLIAAAARSGR